jgi:hypothetical protein
MFIQAERIGDWSLHLKAAQDMLPFLLLRVTTTTQCIVASIYKAAVSYAHALHRQWRRATSQTEECPYMTIAQCLTFFDLSITEETCSRNAHLVHQNW